MFPNSLHITYHLRQSWSLCQELKVEKMEKLPEFISNHIILVTLFIAILSVLVWNLFGTTLSGISQVTPGELTLMMNRENAVVIDLRSEEEFNKGHILNARNIPEGELQSRQKELEKHKSKPIVACCNSGAVAPKIARSIKAMGYEKIFVLKGGILAWQNANLPLSKTG